MSKKTILAIVALGVLGVIAYILTMKPDEGKISQYPEKNEKVIVESEQQVKVVAPSFEVKEGVHYIVLENTLAIPVFSGTVISEFFWFGCPHCQNFEPYVQKWKERLSQNIDTKVSKVAVPGSERWNLDAKMFYTIKKLGGSEKEISSTLALYKTFAVEKQSYPSKEELEDFFSKLGFDSKEAIAIFNSDELNQDLLKANEEYQKLSAKGVPIFVVNGKYKLIFDNINSHEDIFQVLSFLSTKR